MSTIDSLHTHHSIPLGIAPGRLVARVEAWVAKHRERAELTRTLVKMTERDLRDLGINRGDFPAIMDGTLRR